MQRSYIEYAMSVIVSRALPDVRDGLKPVHRRVVYAMYDGGYRPDRGFNKCSRVVGDVMGQYHPHGDAAIYDALVRLVQPGRMRYPLVTARATSAPPGNDPAAAPRYTECKMAPLAMEMVRDIDEDTVDFRPTTTARPSSRSCCPAASRTCSSTAAPASPSAWPRTSRRTTCARSPRPPSGCSPTPTPPARRPSPRSWREIKGPDFPTGALIMGTRGIEDAYRTGRGSIIMRAVVRSRRSRAGSAWSSPSCPTRSTPTASRRRSPSTSRTARLSGIADIRDETSGRTGQRLVIVLKRDAVAKVVLNNLYKHTQLQTNFGANMLALVDGVPRTLPIDAFIRHWVEHQVEVIQRRTAYRLRKAEERIHILRGLLKALDALDEVIALIRRSPTVDAARTGLMELLDIDEMQAQAILDMQLRRLAALERQKIIDDHDELEARSSTTPTSSPSPAAARHHLRGARRDRRRFGDDRRTQMLPFDGDMSMEDLIPEEDVVVTITRGGYAKRTRVDEYRSSAAAARVCAGRAARRGRGRALLHDDLAPLAAVLHQPRPRLPRQGVRAAGCRP
jgi:DNA gyrase subunit A